MNFDAPLALTLLDALDEPGLDALSFGVIGIDSTCAVQRYNARESQFSGLLRVDVIGRHLFEDIARCMNNHLVAGRFEAAAASAQALDDTIDYVLTWRMRPTRIKLRLLSDPACALRYLMLRHV